jgi:hypothetical protein
MFDWIRKLTGRETKAQQRAREREEAEKKRDAVRMERYNRSVGAVGISASASKRSEPKRAEEQRRNDSDDSLSPTNIAVATAIYSSMSSGPSSDHSRSCDTPSYSSSYDSGSSSCGGDSGGGGGGGGE